MLKVQNISKSFKGRNVLHDVSFELHKGEVLSILGKSGSGKTTLLKILAGLEQEDHGGLWLKVNAVTGSASGIGASSIKAGNDRINNVDLLPINKVPAHKRNIIYLYQEPLLFPHLNVVDNIGFGLKVRKWTAQKIKEKTAKILEQIGMQEHALKMPGELSGGQRQRVSFARAIVIAPTVLLLDEPFGALDVATRQQMQQLFKELAAVNKLTALFITHDLKEALIMGDRIGKIEDGKFTVYNSKQEFYNDSTSGARQEAQFWKQFEP